jgi:hypothetical protein
LRLSTSRFRFHRHEQREFVLLRQLPRRFHLRFSHVVRVDAGQSHPGLVDVHHDRERLAARLMEDRLENPDDEVLRRVVVVVKQHAPHPWTLDLLLLALLGERGFFGERIGHVSLASGDL